jgi:hypothetical protein
LKALLLVVDGRVPVLPSALAGAVFAERTKDSTIWLELENKLVVVFDVERGQNREE